MSLPLALRVQTAATVLRAIEAEHDAAHATVDALAWHAAGCADLGLSPTVSDADRRALEALPRLRTALSRARHARQDARDACALAGMSPDHAEHDPQGCAAVLAAHRTRLDALLLPHSGDGQASPALPPVPAVTLSL